MRFPTIYSNKIVFSCGDLYTVTKSGGQAGAYSDVGYEMFSRFSPDGKYIAFNGQYDGNLRYILFLLKEAILNA